MRLDPKAGLPWGQGACTHQAGGQTEAEELLGQDADGKGAAIRSSLEEVFTALPTRALGL